MNARIIKANPQPVATASAELRCTVETVHTSWMQTLREINQRREQERKSVLKK